MVKIRTLLKYAQTLENRTHCNLRHMSIQMRRALIFASNLTFWKSIVVSWRTSCIMCAKRSTGFGAEPQPPEA